MSVGVINALAASDIPWEVSAAGALTFDATPDDAISVAYDAAYGEFCAAWAANSVVTAVPVAKRASGVTLTGGKLFRIAIELTRDEDGVTYAKFYANDNLFYRGLTSLVPDTGDSSSIGLRPYVAFGNSADADGRAGGGRCGRVLRQGRYHLLKAGVSWQGSSSHRASFRHSGASARPMTRSARWSICVNPRTGSA